MLEQLKKYWAKVSEHPFLKHLFIIVCVLLVLGVTALMVTSAAAAAEEAAAEDAVLDAVELEEPPQAARPSAAAPTPAAFRKLRREIRFILCCLHHFVPFKHSRANRLCPKDCVFFCLQYKFFRFLAQEVCCFIFYRCCFLKNSSSESAKNLLKVSA